MERFYNIGGISFSISGKEEEMYLDERQLGDFRQKSNACDYCYDFEVVDRLNASSGVCVYENPSEKFYKDGKKLIRYIGFLEKGNDGAYLRVESLGKRIHVQVRRDKVSGRIPSKFVLNCLGIETLALKAGGFILHSSFIEINGKAILFTAPSGEGKSTMADLWKNMRGAEVLNGDRAIVRIQDNGIDACGLPFAGSSEYCKNAIVPLTAIVYLGKANETSIRQLHGIEAFRKIWEQITVPSWNKSAVEQISEKLMNVIDSLPIYHLVCTPDESAVIALENVMIEMKLM